jgi:hypothetical protein
MKVVSAEEDGILAVESRNPKRRRGTFKEEDTARIHFKESAHA